MTTLHFRGVIDVEHMKAVKILQIETDGALCPVDFEIIPISAADREPGGLEASHASIRKTRKH
jgi:hypothetical protein